MDKNNYIIASSEQPAGLKNAGPRGGRIISSENFAFELMVKMRKTIKLNIGFD